MVGAHEDANHSNVLWHDSIYKIALEADIFRRPPLLIADARFALYLAVSLSSDSGGIAC